MSDPENKEIIVIGGGAAGFFSAINLAILDPSCRVTLLEKSNKLLSKVKISGGGRCNVTHACFDNKELAMNYPRGNKELLQVFSQFSTNDTIHWFGKQGVKLKTEEDGRMFPVSDDSQTIIDLFMDLCKKYKVSIRTNCEVHAIKRSKDAFHLKTSQGELKADLVICALGGHPKAGAYDVLKNLGHTIVDPIPSLFTINLPAEKIRKEIQGISVKQAEVKIGGSKMNYTGPVLVTHWGLSGPAVLKLSAFAAQLFFEKDYQASILVNWVYPLKREEVMEKILQLKDEKANALPYSNPICDIPRRLWEFLCGEAGMDGSKKWSGTSGKEVNKLAEVLTRSEYKMEGKTTFKEEFVTAGGVELKEVDFKTMQSKIVPGLYFCGEVLNIDGITGGFNFQSAWSTAFICARSAAGH